MRYLVIKFIPFSGNNGNREGKSIYLKNINIIMILGSGDMSISTKTVIGLTQFLDFTFKGSAAKTKAVKDIKYQDEYHPAKDYC